MKKRSLKHYLIMPSYQLRLVTFMCLIIFISFILHGCLLYYIAERNVQSTFFSKIGEMRQVWEILKPAVIVTNSLSFMIMSILMIVVSIFISHKLVGPILKVSGHLKKLASGKLHQQSLKLRENDEGQILCDTVNELQQAYRDKFLMLENLKESLENDDPTRQKLEKILTGIEFE